MGRVARAVLFVVSLVGISACGSNPDGVADDVEDAAVAGAGQVVSPRTEPATTNAVDVATPTTGPIETTIATIATIAAETSVVTTIAPTGSQTACPAGQQLEDSDGDLHGECVAIVVAVNTWAAQASAEASGLPQGIPCAYPQTLLAGETAVVTCNVVNMDSSEGSWTFVMSSESQATWSATYVQTKAPPPTTQPPTTPAPIVPFVSTSDPRYDTCKEAKSHGLGPYNRGEPEYGWYRDADSDGVVCE